MVLALMQSSRLPGSTEDNIPIIFSLTDRKVKALMRNDRVRLPPSFFLPKNWHGKSRCRQKSLFRGQCCTHLANHVLLRASGNLDHDSGGLNVLKYVSCTYLSLISPFPYILDHY
jgi:hypothetical protein